MTEPSEAAKRKACELANAHVATGDGCYWPEQVPSDPPLYALALHLDEVDSKMREIVALSGPNCQRAIIARSLMLPDPVGPLEEAWMACWPNGLIQPAHVLAAELAKRGYKLVKETPDD